VFFFFASVNKPAFSIGKKILLILLLGTLCLGKGQKKTFNFIKKQRFTKKNSVIISGDSVIIMIKVSARDQQTIRGKHNEQLSRKIQLWLYLNSLSLTLSLSLSLSQTLCNCSVV
jgi:hypothetical protein